MKAIKLTLLIGASCIAACDSTPTSLDAPRSRTQAKPSDLLIQRGPTGHTTKLPFVPVAINDAGTVAGHQTVGQGTQGVWYNNGTMLTLPLSMRIHASSSARQHERCPLRVRESA